MRLQKEEDVKLLESCLKDKNLAFYISTLNERCDCAVLDIELQLYARHQPKFAKDYAKIQNANRLAIGTALQKIFKIKDKQLPMEPDQLANLFIALVQGTAIQNTNTSLFVSTVLESLLISAPRE